MYEPHRVASQSLIEFPRKEALDSSPSELLYPHGTESRHSEYGNASRL